MTGMMIELIRAFVDLPRNDFEFVLEYLGALLMSVIFVYLILWFLIRVGDKIS